ncbi:SLC45 family MFS transporter [Paenibacillus lemnae]|uniref:SLC45 family MFS transporter n=1 Tax=Paenibacillus lemnae TaxID=1330551 RepID=A0A848M9D8_PAELE|nr:SLC45 family MFS transporter [Paenibacillus lemnae]NMO96503.1 SLC45 family MFS transporter [Paenibacillus lemnae]
MKKSWLLGFGFFSISITWALYNAFVPYFLEKYISSIALIGFFMTLDNYFALFLQPWVGSRSDVTRTRFGRRMPYLLIGMPLGALFTMMIPFHTGLVTLILFMMLMNLSMSIYRSPTVALMPDITPERDRTRSNGIINFMGGFGAILAFGAGSVLYKSNEALPFAAAACITLISMIILFRFIKEGIDSPGYYNEREARPRISFKGQLNRTTVFLLAAIFFWFVAYQGVETLFTLYGKNEMQLSESEASFSLTFFSLLFVLFAIPSGWLGKRYGKKPVIVIGVIGLFLVFSAIPFIDSLLLLRILLGIGGIFWACININSYPFIVSTGSEESIGTRTGMYYLVSSLAAIISPPLLGQMIDWMGYQILFISASGSMLAALLCVSMIREKEIAVPPHSEEISPVSTG